MTSAEDEVFVRNCFYITIYVMISYCMLKTGQLIMKNYGYYRNVDNTQ
jgi:hypothetical protein